MGWQKISYGRRYESSSGHAFIIGGISKGIIGMVLYSKACRKCDGEYKRGEEAEGHECPNNFDGRSKSMDTNEILNMVEDAFHHRCFIIDVIVRKNDSTMQDVLKHPSRGAGGQVMKSSKEKLDK